MHDCSSLLHTLNRDHICAGLEFIEWRGGIPAAHISNPLSQTTVALHGGHVVEFAPKGSKPLLWMSERSRFEPGKPMRGGIPICWPWFGQGGVPAHGFARLSIWSVKSASAMPDGSNCITLSLSETPDTLAIWPFRFSLELQVHAGQSLKVSLKATNTDDKLMALTGALHSYFPVSGIESASVSGLDSVRYVDMLSKSESVQHGKVKFAAETDRLYMDTCACCSIEDTSWKRRIVVSKDGSRSTIVWNPWIDKARRMEDFGDDEYLSMLCIEAANAGDDVIRLAPGQSHTLSTSISSEPL